MHHKCEKNPSDFPVLGIKNTEAHTRVGGAESC